jgi:uncharacterized protein YihD (DUF1040 family)
VRPINRIERVLEKIKKIWGKQPDTRLCQLIMNTVGHERDIFYIEDEELEKLLDKLISEEKK